MITIADTRYELAGFWVRVGALLVDWIVQAIVAFAIFFVIGLAFTDWDQVDAGASSDETLGVAGAIGWLLYILFSVSYYWWGYARGATPGKQALGLRIIRGDGSNPGIGAGFARLIGTWVSGVAVGLGYLWVAWDAKKQAWHDKMADTYVVRGG
ncbi:MAG: RDD family protein [Dehalococcoidia bacterium]